MVHVGQKRWNMVTKEKKNCKRSSVVAFLFIVFQKRKAQTYFLFL
jgi:hypothetical protein